MNALKNENRRIVNSINEFCYFHHGNRKFNETIFAYGTQKSEAIDSIALKKTEDYDGNLDVRMV